MAVSRIGVCAVLLSVTLAQDSKLVSINQGPVRGYKDDKLDVFAFVDIPYATAPSGYEKFKAPLPPPTWETEFEAVDRGIICPQETMFRIKDKDMQEDCLTASVYAPDTNNTNLPVVVIVHGGAYQFGFGNSQTPKQLVNSKKVVAVTFNYRLGIHGFLCLGTQDVPGNAGMKDQVTLLRWVKENIEKFGGNPQDVTICGCSAGGSSVDLLMLSNMAKGLFNKVITLSGASMSSFSLQMDPVENARIHANILGFDDADDTKALEQFYKNASYDMLISNIRMDNRNTSLRFVPCIERDIGNELFFHDNPENIIKSRDYVKYPMMYGFAHMEGIFRIEFFDTWKEDMNVKFSDFLPTDLGFESEEEREAVAKIVKEFYFGANPVENDKVLNYVDYFSDVMFIHSILHTVTLQVEAGNDAIYLHDYSFTDNSTEFIPYVNVRGATHCTELLAVLDEEESKISEEYKNIKSIMREMYINFITTGNPTPDMSSALLWPAVGSERAPCLSVDKKVEITSLVNPERYHFWAEIYQKYRRQPIPPYKEK